MKNFLKRGDTVDLAAPRTLTSGQAALVGNIFGVAVDDVASGVHGSFMRVGLFSLPLHSGDTPAEGAKLYWDDTAHELTTTASTNFWVATCEETVASGVLVRALLNGFAFKATGLA